MYNNRRLFNVCNNSPIVHIPCAQNRRWDLCKLWLILIVLIIAVCVIITIYQRPLDEYDFMKYITQPKSPESNVNLYVLTHDVANISDLNSKQLLDLSNTYIPNLTDFAEDNFRQKQSIV